MERLLTAEQVSDMLQVSKSTVYRWVHYDFIPYIKIGGALRFDEKAVKKWLKARESKGRLRLPIEVEPISRE